MITTLIFDLDGVIIDLCDTHRDCFKQALKIVVGLDITDKYHDEHLNGLPTKTKLAKLGISSDNSARVSKLKQELTLKELEKIQEDKDLQETLIELNDSYNLFCASNSLHSTIEFTLKNLGVIHLFDTFFGNDDVFSAKPSPELYYKCMVKLGATADETLVIEDSPIGEQTIKNAGVYGLMIKNRKELTLDNIFNKIKEIEK
jgi:beta-phosphoglucomutase